MTSWKEGDYCRSVFLEDKVVYEGVLKSVDKTDEGRDYVVVKYLGYGNIQSNWLDELSPSNGPQARQQQMEEAKAAKSTGKWKVGDACRAVFTEDNLEYEGDISDIVAPKEEGGESYAKVIFVGYGNDENVWLSQLLESKGKSARQKQIKESEEKAAKKEINYNVGDNCRAVFTEDGLEYEGKIANVAEADGKKYAVIRFTGYGNEETVWFEDILPSKGSDARKAQRKAAAKEAESAASSVKSSEAGDADTKVVSEKIESIKEEEIEKVVVTSTTIEKKIPEKVNLDSTPVKVEPAIKEELQLKVDADVRCIFSEDNLEYEAKILSIEKTEDGKEYVLVKFHGYGNEETCWVEDLLTSKGPEAIDKQIQESSSIDNTNTTSETPVVNGAGDAKVLDINANETPLSDDSSVTVTGNTNNTEINLKLYFVEKLDKATAENKKLQENITLLEEQISKLRNNESPKVENRVQALEKNLEMEKMEEKVNDLNSKYLSLQKKFEEEQNNYKKLVLDSQKKITEEQNKIQEINNDKESRIKELKTQLESKNAESKNSEDTKLIEELKYQLVTITNKNKELSSKIETMSSEGGATATLTSVVSNHQYKELTKQIDEYKGLLSTNVSQSKLLISKVESLRNENQSLSQENQDLKCQLESVKERDFNESIEEFRPMKTNNFGGVMMPPLPTTAMMPTASGLQPVLCYLPMNNANFGNYTSGNPPQTPVAHSTPAEVSPTNRKVLRRPFPSNDVPDASYNNGKLSIICKGSVGSEKVIKELTSNGIRKERIAEIFDDLKEDLLNLMLDDCGHRVVLALMKVGTQFHKLRVTRLLWEHFASLSKTQGGVELIIEHMNEKQPMTVAFKSVIEKFFENNDVKLLMTHTWSHQVVAHVIRLIKPNYLINHINTHLKALCMSTFGCEVVMTAIINYKHDEILPIYSVLVKETKNLENLPEGLEIIDKIIQKHLKENPSDCTCIPDIMPKISMVSWEYLSTTLELTPGGPELLCKYQIV